MDPIEQALIDVLEETAGERGGNLASYIPELATVDPESYGIAVAGARGQRRGLVLGAGDFRREFTIQSISKPLVYALAVAELGVDKVAEHVGFEPSGEPFNAISVDPASGRPDNPMINAGAIVTTSLVPGSSAAERSERIRRFLSAFAGRDLGFDERVFASEMATGDRNRALAYLARSAGVLVGDADEVVEAYFRQCSFLVTAEDLAVMMATLAGGGVNPCTDEAVVDESVAMATMSLMTMCGMYDESGEWAVRVGLPAKSGVGGGIAAVKPAQFGIATYSPRLDERGNSVRGIAALQTLSTRFGLHLLSRHSNPELPA